jgi:hypothetical protein
VGELLPGGALTDPAVPVPGGIVGP